MPKLSNLLCSLPSLGGGWWGLLFLLCSCSQIVLDEDDAALPTDEPTTEQTRKFTFTIKGDFLSPEFRYGGPAKANAYMTADGAEMTDLWVIDAVSGDQSPDLTIKQQLHQSSTDPDWGTPTMNLSLGTHHILFLASRGQQPTYADGVVQWQKPLDTFCTDYEVTVTKTSNGNRAVTLSRIATKFSLVIEDAVPAGTTTISLAPTRWYAGWNMLTATPIPATDYVATISIPSAWNGYGGTLNAWSVSAPEEWTTDMAITSRAGSSVNASVLITDAPMKANRATVYSGNLYSNSTSSNVQVNAEWLPDYAGVY